MKRPKSSLLPADEKTQEKNRVIEETMRSPGRVCNNTTPSDSQLAADAQQMMAGHGDLVAVTAIDLDERAFSAGAASSSLAPC